MDYSMENSNEIFLEYSTEYEISQNGIFQKKLINKIILRFYGVWNIPGIFHKSTTTSKIGIWNILEYYKEKLLQPKVPI